jgi:hypothetical protein
VHTLTPVDAEQVRRYYQHLHAHARSPEVAAHARAILAQLAEFSTEAGDGPLSPV